ncbi:uncharacterized protein LOC132197780 [Neocloeon triangulifer]|uniref:uncharacterized protein LOC132197780 n=1 Tax=Neocloeon triangulifer TaxID=2078957 RepID=UPI00286ED0FA|nr:uncharacterized protein LOC132197780 [Neocloeon triangulifer]
MRAVVNNELLSETISKQGSSDSDSIASDILHIPSSPLVSNLSSPLRSSPIFDGEIDVPNEFTAVPNLVNDLPSSESDSESSTNSGSIAESVTINSPSNHEEYIDFEASADLFSSDLVKIYNKHNLTQSCLEDILKAARKHKIFKSLPCRAPTLLRLSNFKSNTIFINHSNREEHPYKGEFTYFGLIPSLLQAVEKCPILKKEILSNQAINFAISTDGGNLFKKGYYSKTIWPLMANIISQRYRFESILIGFFLGSGKPDHQEFLADLTHELSKIQSNYIEVDGVLIQIRIQFFTADAPARAFLKQICGHNSKKGCERCSLEQGKGDFCRCHFKNIPVNEMNLRTDASFRSQEDVEHHKGVSSLLIIPNFDIVQDVILDSLHLLDEGAAKRFLYHVLLESKGPARMLKANAKAMDEDISKLATFMPIDFQRRLGPLKFLKAYKATQYRFFLEYAGPVLLKGRVHTNVYNQFLRLHIATRILRSNLCSEEDLLKKSRELLTDYVGNVENTFGKGQIVYNTHSLLHLPDMSARFGLSLDDLSCYSSENFIREILNKIKSGKNISAQICRRFATKERYLCKKLFYDEPFIEWKGECAKINFKYLQIIVPSKNDCFCSLVCGSVVRLIRFDAKSNNFDCEKFNDLGSFFVLGEINSQQLGVKKVSVSRERLIVSIHALKAKLILLPFENKFISFPILHTIC